MFLTCAVKEHVEAVRDEAQGVCPHAVEKLHEGEGEVKQEEAQQVTRVGV